MEATEDERQEVEPFETTVFPPKRSIRNPASRVFHCCLIFPLALVMALAVTSLSYLAVTNEEVGDLSDTYGGSCVLYSKYNNDNNQLDLGSSHACVFAIFGEAAVAVVAALLVVWLIIKTSAGFHLATWILLCEVPVFVLHTVFAFCVSVTISIGLAYTCGEYKKFPAAKGGCGNYTLPRPTEPPGNRVHFYGNIYTSMVTSWLAMVLLTMLVGLHILLFIVFYVRRVRSKSGSDLLPVSDGESSSDGEETDEAMVPIAELEKR